MNDSSISMLIFAYFFACLVTYFLIGGWEDELYPFEEEDFKYKCRVFAFDSMTACYGCCIQKSGHTTDTDIVHKGDIVLWCSDYRIHPKSYISKHFHSF